MVRWNDDDLTLGDPNRREAPVPIFVCWPDVAPTLLHIADNALEAQAYIEGYNRGCGDDGGWAATLADIMADPAGHGLGQEIGGYET